MDEICERLGKKYDSPEEMLNAQKIVHLTGPHKPWVYMLPYASELFKKYYDLSPWRDEELKLISLLPRLYKEERQLFGWYDQLYRRTWFFRLFKRKK